MVSSGVMLARHMYINSWNSFIFNLVLLSYESRAYLRVIGSGVSGLDVAWVLLQQNRYKFKISNRELEFMGLWELAAGSSIVDVALSQLNIKRPGRIAVG